MVNKVRQTQKNKSNKGSGTTSISIIQMNQVGNNFYFYHYFRQIFLIRFFWQNSEGFEESFHNNSLSGRQLLLKKIFGYAYVWNSLESPEWTCEMKSYFYKSCFGCLNYAAKWMENMRFARIGSIIWRSWVCLWSQALIFKCHEILCIDVFWPTPTIKKNFILVNCSEKERQIEITIDWPSRKSRNRYDVVNSDPQCSC